MGRDRTQIEGYASDFQAAQITTLLEKKLEFLRQDTKAEIEENQANLDMLRELQEARRKVITQSGNDDELEELDERIRKIKERVEKGPALPSGQGNQNLLSGKSWFGSQGDEESEDEQ